VKKLLFVDRTEFTDEVKSEETINFTKCLTHYDRYQLETNF